MVKLKLLGGAALESEQGPIAQRAVQRRRVALLALLAVARKPVSREKITAFLWPESDSEQARHLLSVAVYELRKAIHEDAITTTRDEVAINQQHIVSDVAAFETALAADNLEQAVSVYAGPFMDGFHINDAPEFERWVDGERDRLARAYAAALERLAQQYTSTGNTEAAVAAMRKLAAHDPYSGRVACLLMLALESSGDRAAALQHARTHTALLQSEFGADADPEVEALAERLRREPREAGAAPPPHEIPAQRIPEYAPVRKRTIIIPAAITAVVTVFALVALVIWLIKTPGQAGADEGVTMRRVAVLPLTDLSDNPKDSLFSRGLTEEITNALAAVPSFNVVAPTSVNPFRGNVDIQDVAKKLNVDHVLQGTIWMTAERVRVIVRLVDTERGLQVWSEDYDRQRTMQDLLSIQQQIAEGVAEALEARVANTEPGETAVAQQTNSPEAFQRFTAGRIHLHRRTIADMRLALSFFEQAIEKDSNYAVAYAGKAEALALLGAYDYGALRPQEAFPAARAAAQRALQLNPTLAEARTALAAILFNYDRNWEAAEQEFLRAIKLNRGYSTAYHWYSLLLNSQQRHDDALNRIMRARELDPLTSVTATGMARHYYFTRDFKAATDEYKRALNADSAFVTAHVGLGITYAVSGQHQAAIEQFGTAARLLGVTPPLLHALQAYTHGRAGNRTQAEAHNKALRAAVQKVYVPSEIIAMADIGVGDHTAAIASLAQAAENRAGGVNYLRIDPLVDPLRSDPRFQPLLTQVFGQKR